MEEDTYNEDYADAWIDALTATSGSNDEYLEYNQLFKGFEEQQNVIDQNAASIDSNYNEALANLQENTVDTYQQTLAQEQTRGLSPQATLANAYNQTETARANTAAAVLESAQKDSKYNKANEDKLIETMQTALSSNPESFANLVEDTTRTLISNAELTTDMYGNDVYQVTWGDNPLYLAPDEVQPFLYDAYRNIALAAGFGDSKSDTAIADAIQDSIDEVL